MDEPLGGGLSRRDMLRSAGAAAFLGLSGSQQRPARAEEREAQGARWIGPAAVPLALKINGQERKLALEPRVTLLDALRDELSLTGAKRICDRGSCGGCTVWMDGEPVNACMTLAIDAQGAAITTVEGLSPAGGPLHPVQQAFVEEDALQCGFCTPGMVMSCAALLQKTPRPTEAEVRGAVAGNLCRCGTYPHVFRACQKASQR